MNEPDDRVIEALLQRYRPMDAPPVMAVGRTWPWAVAAAALLAIVVGLHAGSVVAAPAAPVPAADDAARALAGQFGGDARARQLADWMVAREQAVEESARESASD